MNEQGPTTASLPSRIGTRLAMRLLSPLLWRRQSCQEPPPFWLLAAAMICFSMSFGMSS